MKFFYGILFYLVASVVIGAGVVQQLRTDQLQIGIGTSPDTKEIIVDVGDGVNNPRIKIDATDKDFSFNKDVKVEGNNITIGDSANTDKKFIFDVGLGANNPFFSWDSTTNALSFSNDSVAVKKIGSGSGAGGGINFLAEENFDFEAGDPPQSWAVSGGTFSAETTSPLFGAQSGSWDANALAQTLQSPLIALSAFGGAEGQVCQAEILYKAPLISEGDYVLKVLDQSSNVIVMRPFTPTVGNNSKKIGLEFDCLTSTDSLQFTIESGVADPDLLILDNAFLGTGKNNVSFRTAMFQNFGASGATNSGVDFYNNFPVVSPPGTSLNVNPDTLFSFDNPTGEITVLRQAFFQIGAQHRSTASSSAISIQIFDPLIDPVNWVGMSTANCTNNTFFCTTSLGINLRAGVKIRMTSSQSGDNSIFRVSAYTEGVEVQGQTYETSGFYIQARIGGAQVNAGTSNVASFVDMAAPTLVMNVSPGSAPAEIPCETVASSGSTCSVNNEVLGIAFDVPKAGAYEVCFDFNNFGEVGNSGATGGVKNNFKISETENASDTLIRDGHFVSEIRFGAFNSAHNEQNTHTVHLCSIFEFPAAKKKATFRLRRTVDVLGTVNQNWILADEVVGDPRNFSITVKNITEGFPTPVFNDLKNSLLGKLSLSGSLPGEYTACFGDVNQQGVPIINRNPSGCIDTVTDGAGGGITNINFVSGTFSEAPFCFWDDLTGNQGVAVNGFISYGTGNTSIRVESVTTGGASVDLSAVNFLCIGRK